MKFDNATIKDFELGTLLGKGAFGSVYEAKFKRDNELSTKVAVKLIDKSLCSKKGMTDRIKNEIEIHSSLHHCNILELYTYFEDDGYFYLVMELCENGELYKFVKRNSLCGNEKATCELIFYILKELFIGI